MGKKIVISEKCVGCGICMENSFVEETPDGKAKAAGAGILLPEQVGQASDAAQNCPANAISIEDISQKSKTEVEALLDSEPGTLKLSVPSKEEFKFDVSKVNIELPYDTGNEYDYRYSSYKEAIGAAREVIRRNMFGNREGIVQDIIGNYLIENFSGYVDYKESDSNFFYSANRQAQGILDKMVGEVMAAKPDAVIPENIKTISSLPDGDRNARGVGALAGGLMNTAGYILSELSGSNYSLQSYAEDADWDDTETYEKGAFGREKTVTKYCYKNIRDAYQSIAKDICSALGWSFDEQVVNPAYDNMKYIVESYEKRLTDELREKAKRLKELLRS